MSRRRARRGARAASAACLICLSLLPSCAKDPPAGLPVSLPIAGDVLRIHGVAQNDEVFVLWRGRTAPGKEGCGRFQVIRASGPLVPLPNILSPGGCGSEIAVFSEKHAMHFAAPADRWTDAPGDVYEIALKPLLRVPITIWITHESAEKRAREDAENARLIYLRNRVGIELVPRFESLWKTNPGAIPVITAGAAKGSLCANYKAIRQRPDIYHARTLNAYYIDFAGEARNCAIEVSPADCSPEELARHGEADGNISFITNDSNATVLAHELGHAFGLRPVKCGGHAEPNRGLWMGNIMWGAGTAKRRSFSLGQVFRMNTHTDRWGGTMLVKNSLREGPLRACRPDMRTAECPPIGLEWDGKVYNCPGECKDK